jgi:hypothetical protein
LTIWLPGSKQEKVISATEFCSWWAFSAEMIGANVARGKWIRGKLDFSSVQKDVNKIDSTYGTKFVWNSFKSTFKEPSKRREAVMEETTWAMSLFKLVKLGEVMPRFFLQMS